MKVRLCPKCHGERPFDELYCQGEVDGAVCGWDLTFVPLTDPVPQEEGTAQPEPPVSDGTGSPAQAEAADLLGPRCPNGHPIEPGDLICPECGADIEDAEAPAPTAPERVIAGWRVVSVLDRTDGVRERLLVRVPDTDREAVLTLYENAREPDPEVYAALRHLDLDHVPEVLGYGRVDGRFYEVAEYLPGGNLGAVTPAPLDTDALRRIVAELGAALSELSRVGLRHRDLRPETVLVRAGDPLDLAIGGFGSARLSDLDLDLVAPLASSRYMAPEAIAGAVAAASDWWSLGVLLLEKATGGACFEGVNDQAFLIHALVDGVALPQGLDPEIETLLRGLLTRDREHRWQWPEVSAWLAGEPVEVVAGAQPAVEPEGAAIVLGGQAYHSPRRYALAAAEEANWDEALVQLRHGALASWLEDGRTDPRRLALVRNIAATGLDPDIALALTLKVLNPDLPLVQRGVIVSPGWLLEHPEQGYALVAGEAPAILAELGAEPWLVELRRRADLVRERAAYHEIDLVEERLRVLLLSTSGARLRALWDEQRRLFPDSDHRGLVNIIDRYQWSDEDLILLLAAEPGQYRPIEEVVAEAAALCDWAGIPAFDPDAARRLLREQTRRELFGLVRERIADFAACDHAGVNEWAARFRIENRTQLARALAILAIPPERWVPPPHQVYLGQLLEFFEQKAVAAIRRGPLARMRVTRTGQRIDLTELGTERQGAEALLDAVLARTTKMSLLDPAAFLASGGSGPDAGGTPSEQAGAVARERGRAGLESRLRNLARHAALYRRDTGIDGLYLGFPFLLLAVPGDGVKPRIAPVLLWPVRLEAELGRQGQIRLGFDPEREEVRLNPALEGYLGTEAIARWSEAAESALGRDLRVRDLIDELGRLAIPRGRELVALPGLDLEVAEGPGELQCSAVLFHMAFMGQALVEDLRQLRGLQPEGTALAPMLRIGEAFGSEAPERDPGPIPEHDRYFTVASDPSQEDAVLSARLAPGIQVSGPPGTGKSQTIVNIVGDAIGRKRSVLVVCQKQAALEVVHKRLEKEGLGARTLMISDMNKDRLAVIRAVREQVESGRPDAAELERRRAERAGVAARIEELEARIDRRHEALHNRDPESGHSYRSLVGELVAVEAGARPVIASLAVRGVVGALDRATLERLEGQVLPLAGAWLAAGYEDSPLTPLKPFPVDASMRVGFLLAFQRFVQAERARERSWVAHPTRYLVASADAARDWLDRHGAALAGIAAEVRADLARWLRLFQADQTGDDSAAGRRRALEGLADDAVRLAAEPGDPAAVAAVSTMSSAVLEETRALAESATTPVGLLGRLSPTRILRRRRLRRLLVTLGLAGGDAGMIELHAAAVRERRLRGLRQGLIGIDLSLGIEDETRDGAEAAALARLARERIERLDRVVPFAVAIADCPADGDAAVDAAREGTAKALGELIEGVGNAIDRAAARGPSRQALEALGQWFEADWLAAVGDRIDRGDPDLAGLSAIEKALSRLEPFQRFRARVPGLAAESVACFAALREVADTLAGLPADELASEVRRVIRREAALAWKGRMEAACPELLAERAEMDQAIERLAALDRQMRELNRRHLIEDIDPDAIASRRAWEDITRLRGPRSRRLREFVEIGVGLGLMALRPVWLMNPNVASQVLPLNAALFDLVVFDEASQMPVEHALPSLYRGGIAVVSGDEKQLPPTAFFSSRVESDEAETFDGDFPDVERSDEEIEVAEERWNRREIKDCPDLLALAGAALPPRMLEVHYRSNYRELIAFSNAAFYGGRLHVPVQHPAERVRVFRPIEVVRVDGTYRQQTNPEEAERVVDLVAEVWAGAGEAPPTLGVVTFNRKQADLIEDRLEARAETDAAFRDAYRRELDRREDGEDLGFFVKNLENVQGDERDIMLFSTTFGRNAQGRFRRNFGVLGQRGGERRLNVAVTRARDKVMLATSMPVAEVSDLLGSARPPARPRDYLQAYLAYAEHLSAGELDAAGRLVSRLQGSAGAERAPAAGDGREDPFAELVGRFIRERLGQEPVAVSDGTAFGLDWAIRGSDGDGFRIGIECDSPRHRLLASARAREIWRPAVLGRSIPLVHRVSSVDWYAEPEREQQRLVDAIGGAIGLPGAPREAGQQ